MEKQSFTIYDYEVIKFSERGNYPGESLFDYDAFSTEAEMNTIIAAHKRRVIGNYAVDESGVTHRIAYEENGSRYWVCTYYYK